MGLKYYTRIFRFASTIVSLKSKRMGNDYGKQTCGRLKITEEPKNANRDLT